MPLYVIERNFAEQLDPDELDREGIALVNDDVGIRWLYSFLSADRKKTYCLYEAPNPEALLEAAARLGIPADVIVPVERIEAPCPPADGSGRTPHRPSPATSNSGGTMTITTTPGTGAPLLSDELLARFDERAPVYDRENRFFDEDFAELREVGFLDLAIPTEFGGKGYGLDAYSQEMRRLGYVAPATALAVNMHVYWTGVAADLLKAGDESCRWMLEKAADGAVFAALHGEAGNDMPLLASSAQAERTDGGWLISGHKIFGSLSPVWTYGGFHAMDTSDPAAPQIVHGFLPREAEGYQIIDTWDTLGMRATQSQDTVLDRTFVPDELVRAGVPGRVRRRRPVPRGDLRLGPDGLQLRLPRRGAAGLRHDGRADAAAHVGGAHPVDGSPPRGAALSRRHADGLRRRRGAARAHDRRLDERRRARRLARAPRQHPPDRDQQRLRDRRHGARPLGRCGIVQAQPARAALPRRPDGPLPPGQHVPRPRADRQAVPRPQPRRRPPLGLIT